MTDLEPVVITCPGSATNTYRSQPRGDAASQNHKKKNKGNPQTINQSRLPRASYLDLLSGRKTQTMVINLVWIGTEIDRTSSGLTIKHPSSKSKQKVSSLFLATSGY